MRRWVTLPGLALVAAGWLALAPAALLFTVVADLVYELRFEVGRDALPVGSFLLSPRHTRIADTLGNVLRGDLIGRTVTIRLRTVPADHVPNDDAGRRAWLADLGPWMDHEVDSLQARVA